VLPEAERLDVVRSAKGAGAARAAFVLAALAGAAQLLVNAGGSLETAHAFRQTQTAINAYSILHGANWLAYQTPVLGAPWSLPFEFPLYQGIVASLCALLHTPLDATGRFVSIAFFIATLRPLWIVLRELDVDEPARYVVLALLACNPFFLFWSRAFLIESTALYLGMQFLADVAVFVRRPTIGHGLRALIVGTLGALVKVTTFAVFVIAAALFVVWWWRRGRTGPGAGRALALAGMLGIPICAGAAWTRFADGVKSRNPIGTHLTSAALRDWNFGTATQKRSPAGWEHFLVRLATEYWADAALAAIVLAVVFLFARRRLLVAACLAIFFCGPLLFTNLYFVHDYYVYGSGVFLIAAIGIALSDALFSGDRRRIGLAAGTFLVVLQAVSYERIWYPLYFGQYGSRETLDAAHAIAAHTRPTDVVEVYGFDWSPELAYYSERRELMHPQWLPDTSPLYAMQRRTSGSPALLAFCSPTLGPIGDRSALVRARGFASRPVFANGACRLYRRLPRWAAKA